MVSVNASESVLIAAPAIPAPPRTLIKVMFSVVCFSIAFACFAQIQRAMNRPIDYAETQRLFGLFLIGGTFLSGGIGAMVGHFRIGVLLFVVWIGLPVLMLALGGKPHS